MIVTTSGEGERLLPEKMAKMDVLTCDLLHLSLPETAVPVATIMATLQPALRIRIKIAGTKDLQLEGLPNGDPVCLGHHEYLDLAEDEESQMNCFEVFEQLVSKFRPLERQLSELALQVCSAGAPHVVPIPKTLRQRCSEMLELHGGRGGFGHLLSFYCAKALHRRNDMMPQVLSNQWPQVRHFLRRALEQEFRQMGDADVPKELQVLQQKFKMARQLGADAATVLAPQLITSPSTSAVAVEALNAWLATALEAGEAQLPQLLSLGSSAARASPDILDAAVLAAARARVRLQELQRYEDVSIHEILVTVEAASSAAPEMKWPLAGRFLGCEPKSATCAELALPTQEMAIYSPLTPDTPDPEAPPQAVDKPEASQHWPLRTLSGILAIFGVATLCFWKLQLAAEAKVQKANVMASEMKMSNYYYPPCPTGTFHQCPETWDSGYHCLHSESFHHAKNYEKFNCRKVSEGPFPLKECLNQCRIGHFGKGRWAAHPYEDTNGKGPAQVGDLPLDSIYDGSDFVNGKAPPDAVYGSDFVNGKGPAQVGDLPLDSIYDGSDFVNGKAPPVSFSGSDFVNGKAPPVFFSGSDFVNG
eukprot:symbB.v1.2.006124.t1/scaffold364.1/size219240/21